MFLHARPAPFLSARPCSVRAIARFDSDDDDAVVVCDTPVALPAAQSPEETLGDEEEVDELWPDTPKPARTNRSAVLAMLDLEAEEADDEGENGEEDDDVDAAWLDDSPPPRRVDSRGLKAQSKGKAKAVERPAAAPKQQASSNGKATRRSSVSVSASVPITAVVEGSAADIFGGPVDDPIAGDL